MTREPKQTKKLEQFMSTMMEELSFDPEELILQTIRQMFQEMMDTGEKKPITMVMIADKVGIPATTTRRHILKLEKSGRLKRIGVRPSYWFLS